MTSIPGLQTELRPLQAEGVATAAWWTDHGLGGIIADEMGFGKTLQILALELAERAGMLRVRRPAHHPTLVIVPKSVISGWLAQGAQHTPSLRIQTYLSGDDPTTEFTGDIVLTTRDVVRLQTEKFRSIEWWRTVVDEAHKIKNSDTQASRAIRSLTTQHRLAMTGTPVENGIIDLFGLFSFVMPGLLGSKTSFQSQYGSATDDDLDKLRQRVAPFMLGRTMDLLNLDLPPLGELVVEAGLTDEQYRLYVTNVDSARKQLAESDPKERGMLAIKLLDKLRAIINHPAQYAPSTRRAGVFGRSGKLAVTDRLVAKHVAQGEKILIFSDSKRMAGMLDQHLHATAGAPVYLMSGDTSDRQRRADIDEFSALEGPAVYVLTTGVGSDGLNLQSANVVIHYDLTWTPAKIDQASRRAYRPGQTRAVTVYHLRCPGTIDEHVGALVDAKRNVAEKLAAKSIQRDLAALPGDALIALFQKPERHHGTAQPAAAAVPGPREPETTTPLAA
jgi:SNF2 family DNA or RNA helicase